MDETLNVNVTKLKEIFLNRRFSDRAVQVRQKNTFGKVAAIIQEFDGEQK